MSYSDQEIIKGISRRNNAVVDHVYTSYYKKMRSYTLRNYGFTEEDSKDFFQDLMALIYEKTRKRKFSITCTFRTYLYAMANQILNNMVGKRITRNSLKPEDLESDIIDYSDDLAVEKVFGDYRELRLYEVYRKQFRALPEECKSILRLSFKKMPYDRIKEKLKLSSENFIKKKKSQCLQYLKQKIKNDPIYIKQTDDDNDTN